MALQRVGEYRKHPEPLRIRSTGLGTEVSVTVPPSLAAPSGRGVSAPDRTGDVSTQRLGGCVIARLAGEFGVADALPLQRTLYDLVATDDVVVDLSRTRLMPATVLPALTAAHDEAARRRTSLHVTGASSALRRLLRRSGSEARLNYHEHLADAVESALAARDARISAPHRS